jgi:hypothetical protein
MSVTIDKLTLAFLDGFPKQEITIYEADAKYRKDATDQSSEYDLGEYKYRTALTKVAQAQWAEFDRLGVTLLWLEVSLTNGEIVNDVTLFTRNSDKRIFAVDPTIKGVFHPQG